MSDLLSIERAQFSERLQHRMAHVGIGLSGAALAHEFNSRITGKGISIRTALNWIHGRNMPARPRMTILAKCLNVTPEWLKTGSGVAQASAESIALAAQIESLPPYGKEVARRFIRSLVGLAVDST